MEALLEPLFELIAEIVLNIIAYILGEFIKVLDYDSKLRKTIKYIISFIFFGLSILVLVFSFMYHKDLIIIICISFMFVGIIASLFKYINKNIWKNNVATIVINWIRRIIHYSFPIVLLVFGNLTLVDKTAIIWLNIGCCLAILIFFSMDMYRLRRFIKNRNNDIYY